MKLYCGTYNKYNNGSLAGQWMDLDEYTDADAFFEACTELHADEADPELMFQDCDGEEWERAFYAESLCHSDLENYYQIKDTIEGNEIEPFVLWCEHVGENVDASKYDAFQDAYRGQWNGESEYAQDLFDEIYLHDVPESVRYYIDYEAFARDLFISDCFSIDCGGGVYVFENH